MFNNTNIFTQNNNNTQNLFQQPQQNQNLFNANVNSNVNNNNQYPSQPVITSTKPILALQSTNSLRYMKIENMSDDVKKIAQKIQMDLLNNEMHITFAEKLIQKLEDNFNAVKNEGINLVKYGKVVNTKNTKIKYTINNIKSELQKIASSLEKEKNNYRVIELGSDMNITIPNDFLLYFTNELEERMLSYASQIEDIQTLINLYYSEENGNFTMNSDMVEELIIELYKCIKILLSDEAVLNEYVNSVKNGFIDMLKSYGFNDYQIKARFEGYQTKVQ